MAPARKRQPSAAKQTPDAMTALKLALEQERKAAQKTTPAVVEPTPAAPVAAPEPPASDASVLEAQRAEAAQLAARTIVKALKASKKAAAAPSPPEPPKVPETPLDAPSLSDYQRTSSAPRQIVHEKLPEAHPIRFFAIEAREAFVGMWTAHRSLAQASQALDRVLVAERLIEAAQSLPVGGLYAVHLRVEQVEWAVFIDVTHATLLAALTPAKLYLEGLR